MGGYLIRRLLLIIPTLFLISVMVFGMIRLIPGDVVSMMLDQYQYAKNVEELKHKLGLDKPIHIQYLTWIKNVAKGDLGVSLWTKRSALEEVKTRFPVTLELSLYSIFFSLVIALPVGILAAIRQDTWLDYLARSFTIGALSIPSFWLATLFLVIPSILFKISPPIGNFRIFSDDPWGHVSQFLFPAFAMGLAQSGVIMRMARAMILEVLRQDYIRTAWAKGLSEKVIVLRHTLRNALIPIVDVIGIQMPFYFGGTIIMEYIFGLPGMGSFVFEAINKRDYPMIQAITLFLAILIIITNLIVDLSYGYLDPRIRYKE